MYRKYSETGDTLNGEFPGGADSRIQAVGNSDGKQLLFTVKL